MAASPGLENDAYMMNEIRVTAYTTAEFMTVHVHAGTLGIHTCDRLEPVMHDRVRSPPNVTLVFQKFLNVVFC